MGPLDPKVCSSVPPIPGAVWWFAVMGRDAFDRFWAVLAASLGHLQPNFGPTWSNFGQLGRNFGQLGCKIDQLRTKMALNCTILNQNGPLGISKIIVFPLEFVWYRDVSLDATFGQLKPTWGQNWIIFACG